MVWGLVKGRYLRVAVDLLCGDGMNQCADGVGACSEDAYDYGEVCDVVSSKEQWRRCLLG